ncbi:MAG TPA: HD domain-containing phosphohydrolase [Gemmatimonadaceae bacterium]|nr:HD domain-containing phosphohydrolase [Gemmatimonadaceae bacterium]
MSEPIRFLTSFAQSLSTMALYGEGHPARQRAVDRSFDCLRELQTLDVRPRFSFIGDEVVYGDHALREMADWEWAPRLADAGVQRLEFEPDVSRDEYEEFLEQVVARMMVAAIDTAEARVTRRTGVKFGALGIRGESASLADSPLRTATINYSLGEEIETVRWMHREVEERGGLPLIEAEAVVRSLSVAMHGDSAFVLPLLQLKEFDEYTTTHSLNVSVLTMALAEHLGLGARDVRGFGVAGLLHDLGKVRIPKEILNKPGKLTDEERRVMQGHTAEGARIILSSDRELDLAAAVAYEHHIMLNGGGYPRCHFHRECHHASHLVHVCDVYDALRTNRPYRGAWETEKVLAYIEEKAGSEFEPVTAGAFVQMMRQAEGRVLHGTIAQALDRQAEPVPPAVVAAAEAADAPPA